MVETPRPKRILVVDDEEPLRVLLRHLLASVGYLVDVAANGREGLEKIQTFAPDLVVLDLMMPVMDGWEVLRRLQAIANAPPVLVLSAYLDLSRARQAGAAACLQKPFGFAELRATCAELLALQRSRASVG